MPPKRPPGKHANYDPAWLSRLRTESRFSCPDCRKGVHDGLCERWKMPFCQCRRDDHVLFEAAPITKRGPRKKRRRT